jgi:hypothetical protein
VLQGVETERDNRRSRVAAPNAENTALLAELVVVERMCGQHDSGDLRCADDAL